MIPQLRGVILPDHRLVFLLESSRTVGDAHFGSKRTSSVPIYLPDYHEQLNGDRTHATIEVALFFYVNKWFLNDGAA